MKRANINRRRSAGRVFVVFAVLFMWTGLWNLIAAKDVYALSKIPSVSCKASKYLLSNIERHNSGVSMKKYSLTFRSKDLKERAVNMGKYIFNLQLDNPDLFYIDSTGCGWVFYCDPGDRVRYITVGYTIPKNTYKKAIKKYNAAIGRIVRTAEKKKSVRDRVISVNDQICKTASNNCKTKHCHSAYGALVERKAACMGYALAFRSAMDKLGIPSDYAMNSSRSHIWNRVKIGGKWYHVDVTWNDRPGKQANKYLLTKKHA